MNRKCLLYMLILSIFIFGCNEQEKSVDSISSEDHVIVDTTPTNNIESADETNESSIVEEPSVEISLNQEIEIPNKCLFTIKSMSLTDALESTNKKVHMYIAQNEGSDYLYACVSMECTNLATESLYPYNIGDITMVVDEEYIYTGSITSLDTDKIPPLGKNVILMYVPIPIPVTEFKDMPVVNLTIFGNKYHIVFQQTIVEPKFTTLEIGEEYEIPEVAKFHISEVQITDKVLPHNTKGRYQYIELSNDNNLFVDVQMVYMNLGMEKVDLFDVGKAVLVCDNKYKYDVNWRIENNAGNILFTNITDIDPLQSGNVHIPFEVPAEFINNGSPLELILTMSDEEYRMQIQ